MTFGVAGSPLAEQVAAAAQASAVLWHADGLRPAAIAGLQTASAKESSIAGCTGGDEQANAAR